jgi:hypothetical protein
MNVTLQQSDTIHGGKRAPLVALYESSANGSTSRDPVWRGTLVTFCADNGMTDEEMEDAARRIARHGFTLFGGGASPVMVLRRDAGERSAARIHDDILKNAADFRRWGGSSLGRERASRLAQARELLARAPLFRAARLPK